VDPGDPAVRSHVLKHELILLQRLESPLAHILLLETESTIGGGRQLIRCSSASAPGLDQPVLDQTRNGAARPPRSCASETSPDVWRLIEVFAKAAETDVMRVRAPDGEAGSVNVSDGVTLMHGARDMLLSAACSLWNPQPLYRAGANKEAREYLKQVRIGQTEQGSFVITLLSPVVPPRMQLAIGSELAQDDDPIERRITRRLVGALTAVREATEIAIAGGADAFFKAIERGVSANLCEALVSVMEPFREIDVTVTWARTCPAPRARDVVRFAASDAPILREAARSFRSREPQPDRELVGFVRMLKRGEAERDGTVTLLTSMDGKNQSVATVLKQADYERAVSAHKEQASVVVKGDLERVGQRWSLLNPMIMDVIRNVDASIKSES